MAVLPFNEHSSPLDQDEALQSFAGNNLDGVSEGRAESPPPQNKPHDMAALPSAEHTSQLNKDNDRPLPSHSLSCINGNVSYPGQLATLPSLPSEPYVSGAPSEIGGSGSQLERRRAPIVRPAAW
ncbi:hypothetical protein HPB48_009591 [Haemaphysalis longicornis]|uniref:Uncharacterized protein n=1 Tax=Haemaphysalis longicornis TaxID=44386 RepID=A0A9J6FBH8_HAELO|nr:hypothetical protein HPB48_009591 [Haemaphysalis longicornis]